MNNLINSTDGLIIIGTTSAYITLSITGVGIIVVPITAGVGCANLFQLFEGKGAKL